jgi:peroxisomal 2,4-dienoyl-CoA reductase
MSKPFPESPFKANILKSQVALITGGGTGINFGIATQLAQHGCNLVLVGRRLNIVEEAARKLSLNHGIIALGLTCDVRKAELCEEVIRKIKETFGRLDILVNGAAGNFLAPIEKLSLNAFRTVYEIDVFGTYNMTKCAFEILKANPNKSSLIINITATLSRVHAPFMIHASSAKDAIESMTASLANEWGPYGIRAVAIAPGYVEGTEGFERLGGFAMSDKEKFAQDHIPIAYFCTVADIGLTALFLASAGGRYINGTTIVVDGGNQVNHKPAVDAKQLEEITARLRAGKGNTAAKL